MASANAASAVAVSTVPFGFTRSSVSCQADGAAGRAAACRAGFPIAHPATVVLSKPTRSPFRLGFGQAKNV
jgi:hypothetical protein